MCIVCLSCFFLFKQKTAYEVLISDWSSDVFSSDLGSAFLCLGELGGDHVEDPAAHHLELTRAELSGLGHQPLLGGGHDLGVQAVGQGVEEIGRASCRERVTQYV